MAGHERRRSLACSFADPEDSKAPGALSLPEKRRRASVAAAAQYRECILKLIADVESEAESREGGQGREEGGGAAGRINDVLDTRRGKTALHFCAERNEVEACEVLLSCPAIDVNVRRKDGATALFSAAMHGSSECVALLLEGSSAAVSKQNSRTPVDVNAVRTLDGSTPLCIAAQQGNASVVELLLREPSIKLNLCSNNGCSPLFIAAYKNRLKIVEMLLQCENKGGFDGLVDVNKVEADGCSPLWIAAGRGHLRIVEALVCGAAGTRVDFNLCDHLGRTPLFMAAFQGHAEIARMLLENGARGCNGSIDMNVARNTDGSTPLYVASARPCRCGEGSAGVWALPIWISTCRTMTVQQLSVLLLEQA